MLFTATELGNLLDCTVSAEKADQVERIVWGWLKPVLALEVRPDPVPDPVYSWAIELGAIAHENPAGLTSYQLGSERSQYSWERRAQILQEAAGGGLTPGSGAPAPTGSFPPARAYPDPLECW